MTRFKNEWTDRIEYLQSLNAALIANVEAKAQIMDSLSEENAELSLACKKALQHLNVCNCTESAEIGAEAIQKIEAVLANTDYRRKLYK